VEQGLWLQQNGVETRVIGCEPHNHYRCVLAKMMDTARQEECRPI